MSSEVSRWADEQISRIDVPQFRTDLIEWGRAHGRTFPWRETRDPYKILISEVLLHRTRAEQVVPLYSAVTRDFPRPSDLADAPLQQLQLLLQSAGLRWRVDLLGATARELVSRFEGEIPRSDADLQSLPGVGPYISGAVLCFAFGKPVPILDTNTVRILGRVFGLAVTDGSRRSLRFRTLMAHLVDPDHPREFNYALLDLGALICRAKTPLAGKCPLSRNCDLGRRLGAVFDTP
jgi:A/G-specific adenine glycosylase